MTVAAVITALGLPPEARIDQRVSKKLLVDNGAPTAADKRQINDGIQELVWLAALKPATVGVPEYRDQYREYLEIAILSLSLRPDAKAARLTELIHRAIPYPVFLIQEQESHVVLSLAHLRWSQGQAGQTVLDGPVQVVALEAGMAASHDFVAALAVASQPRQNLYALYQGWWECFETYAAMRLTGRFQPANGADATERRRVALAEHERLTREIANLRAQAARETQVNRLVEMNLKLKSLEEALDLTTASL
jgi:hypothetical protein